jgi:hypothetical protein
LQDWEKIKQGPAARPALRPCIAQSTLLSPGSLLESVAAHLLPVREGSILAGGQIWVLSAPTSCENVRFAIGYCCCFALPSRVGSEDRLAALTAADELDASAATGRGAPRFFSRTTKEVCEAILAPGDPHSHDALRRHADRIEDPRLRRAFEAAVDLL